MILQNSADKFTSYLAYVSDSVPDASGITSNATDQLARPTKLLNN